MVLPRIRAVQWKGDKIRQVPKAIVIFIAFSWMPLASLPITGR